MTMVFIGYFPDSEKPMELPESVKRFAAALDEIDVPYCIPKLPVPVKGSPEYNEYALALREEISYCNIRCMIVDCNADESCAIWNAVMNCAIQFGRVTFLYIQGELSAKFNKIISHLFIVDNQLLHLGNAAYEYSPENPLAWNGNDWGRSSPVMDFRGEWLSVKGTRQDILGAILSGSSRQDIPEVPRGDTYKGIVHAIQSGYTPASEREADILRQYADILFDSMLRDGALIPKREWTHLGQDMPRNEECCCLLISNPFVTYSDYYYINLKKSAYVLLAVLAKCALSKLVGEIPGDCIAALWACQFPEQDLAIFRKLDSNSGEVCLLTEARTEKKNGIDKNYLSKFRGECVNSDIPCVYRYQGSSCECTPTRFETLCETLVRDRILRKEGERYYYTDFI